MQRKIFKYTKTYKIINMQITKQLKEKYFIKYEKMLIRKITSIVNNQKIWMTTSQRDINYKGNKFKSQNTSLYLTNEPN